MIALATIAAFKRQYHRAREAREALESNDLRLTMKANVETQRCEIGLAAAPAEQLCRLAANVEPLADPDNRLHYKRVARLLGETPEATADKESKKLLDRVVAASLPTGPRLSFNGKDYQSRDLHRLLARGGFFAEDDGVREELHVLLSTPFTAKLVWFSFFSHAGNVLKACDAVYTVIRRLEKGHPERFEHEEVRRKGPCIYCGESDGGFTSVEHIYPESLGNTELVLGPGIVCDQCNHIVLSPLDDYFVNWDPIAMLRVVNQAVNPKTGKFPRARMQELSIEKTAPRHLRVVMHHGERGLHVEERGEEVAIQMNVTGRQKFDPIRVGRALYKIALGFVAYQQGPEAVLAGRYDAARRFVLGTSQFHNRLALSRAFLPTARIQTTYDVLNPGTPVWLNIFGMQFVFNLEEQPLFKDLPEIKEAGYDLFDLWGPDE